MRTLRNKQYLPQLLTLCARVAKKLAEVPSH